MSAKEIKKLEEERERKRKEEERERKRKLREERRQRAIAAVKASGARRILKLPEVEATTGLKKSSIYEIFKPVPIGERASGFLSDEIDAWLAQRVAARDHPAKRSLPLATYQAEVSAHKEPKNERQAPSKHQRERVPLLNDDAQGR
jgi:prophage regulatory protein